MRPTLTQAPTTIVLPDRLYQAAANGGRARLLVIDVVRGLAIAGVVVFHLVWDLDFSGLIPAGTSRQPEWVLFARIIAGTFMILVGIGLVLAHSRQMRWTAFARRLGIIVLAAAAISLATRVLFPQTFVYFGMLHAIAAASMIGVFFVRVPATLSLLAGLFAVILPFVFADAGFNTRWLAWIGFAKEPPASIDLVPIFPWVGLALLGIALTKSALKHSMDDWLKRREPSGAIVRSLAWLGRHTLIIYLLHQPVLLAFVMPLANWMD